MKIFIYLTILGFIFSGINCSSTGKPSEHTLKREKQLAIDEANKKIEEELDKKLNPNGNKTSTELPKKEDNDKKSVDNTAPIQPSIVDNWGFQGWGGSPDIVTVKKLSDSDKKDWFYTKVKGKATDRAIALKSPSYIEFTCKNSAKMDNKDYILDSMIGSIVDSPPSEEAKRIRGKIDNGQLEFNIVECKSEGSETNYSNCECMVYSRFAGGKEEFKRAILK